MGLSIVGAAVLSALLVVPRKVVPELVPPPVIDRIQQAHEQEVEAQRAEHGRAGLPLEVRSVGEAFRRFGYASFEVSRGASALRHQVLRLAEEARARHGDEPLLELRALQTDLFVRALQVPSDAKPTVEQRELGGHFLALGRRRGWFGHGAQSARDPELRALFHIYWGETLGLGRHPYSPTLNEWRAYYRFLLAQPVPEGPEREGDLQLKLRYVAALVQHDESYPSHLARGVLLYQQGAFADAAGEFQAHLEQHPDGPWTLRARNHLAACGAALELGP